MQTGFPSAILLVNRISFTFTPSLVSGESTGSYPICPIGRKLDKLAKYGDVGS